MKKKKFVTVITIETDFDPSGIGPSQLVLAACTGGGNIISKEVKEVHPDGTETLLQLTKESL